VDQCALACKCQRVACCCGPNCNMQGSSVLYNRCVDAGSDATTWSCPTIQSCSSFGGRAMTITPCATTPTPASNSGEPESASLEFGTTFPLIGTQAVAHQTWQQGIYMGTIQTFNPGATWDYTDSFNAPNWNTAQYDAQGNLISTGSVEGPTPAPDYSGIPCSISNVCPKKYYCKLNTGNNIQQRGTCMGEPSGYWTGGAGQFTESPYYTGMANPNLVLDPYFNGPANYASDEEPYYGSGSGAGGPFGNRPYGAAPPGASNSCASPSNCGYKAAYGDCWCDGKCQSNGDCCPDISRYCRFVGQ